VSPVTARLNVRGGTGTVVLVLVVLVEVDVVLVVRGFVAPGFVVADAAIVELAVVVVGVRSRTTAWGAAATDAQATHNSVATAAASPVVGVVCRPEPTLLCRPEPTLQGSHSSATGRGMPALRRLSDVGQTSVTRRVRSRYLPAGRIRRLARPRSGVEMDLIHEFTYQAQLGDTLMPGRGPLGTRAIATVAGGWARGERINGTVVGPGAGGGRVGCAGFNRRDVRTQIHTHDGAVLYLAYTGLLEFNEAAQRALVGGETQFDDQYFRTTPHIETGHPEYAWVNTTLFVARGRFVPGAVEYEVFRVT
jgi:hypothetical protein